MQNNTTVKDLVLYVPVNDENSNSSSPSDNPVFMGASPDNRFLFSISRFCNSRRWYYCFFISVFFLLSVLAGCVFAQSRLSVSSYSDVALKELMGTITIMFCCSFVAFISGFTVFSYPITILASLRFYYNTAFAFYAYYNSVSKIGVQFLFAYVLLFSVIVLGAAVFFSETIGFYWRTKGFGSVKVNLYYVIFYLAFLLSAVLSAYIFSLLLHSS